MTIFAAVLIVAGLFAALVFSGLMLLFFAGWSLHRWSKRMDGRFEIGNITRKGR